MSKKAKIKAQEAKAARASENEAIFAALPAKVQTFFCERTGESFYSRSFHCALCKHHFWVPQGRAPTKPRLPWPDEPHPCPKCGAPAGRSSQSSNPYFRRADTGEEIGGEEKLPAGAIWAADPDHAYQLGPDGRALYCQLPDGHSWCIDGLATNCTKPEDKEHRCWVRTGSPEEGTLHVGKGGNTCSAGAGSIKTPTYHGFLRNGVLEKTRRL